jgi:hypothetical protein
LPFFLNKCPLELRGCPPFLLFMGVATITKSKNITIIKAFILGAR